MRLIFKLEGGRLHPTLIGIEEFDKYVEGLSKRDRAALRTITLECSHCSRVWFKESAHPDGMKNTVEIVRGNLLSSLQHASSVAGLYQPVFSAR